MSSPPLGLSGLCQPALLAAAEAVSDADMQQDHVCDTMATDIVEPEADMESETGMEPDSAMEPETDIAPDTGVESDSSMEPETGVESDTGMESETGVESDTGMEPETAIAPDTDMEPGTGMNWSGAAAAATASQAQPNPFARGSFGPGPAQSAKFGAFARASAADRPSGCPPAAGRPGWPSGSPQPSSAESPGASSAATGSGSSFCGVGGRGAAAGVGSGANWGTAAVQPGNARAYGQTAPAPAFWGGSSPGAGVLMLVCSFKVVTWHKHLTDLVLCLVPSDTCLSTSFGACLLKLRPLHSLASCLAWLQQDCDVMPGQMLTSRGEEV